ncbi:MAG: glucose-1-phosphate thymidylyltransferase [Calditrichia bacterium]
MKALITAGGKGTRLRPITHTQNKHLIPIGNKPMLLYAIDAVKEAGITEIGIIVNADSDEVQQAFGDGSQYGVSITYIPQEAPLGLAHVVKISKDFIGDDSFIFYLGDNMLVGGVSRFINKFKETDCNCLLTLAKVHDPSRFGVPELKDGKIISIEEKPKNPKSPYAVSGIYVYDQSIFEAVNNIEPSARGELEISDAHQYLIDKGYTIAYEEISGWWKDTGKPDDLLEANRLVLDNLPVEQNDIHAENSHISGKVKIGNNVKIANSQIRGPVIIGDNCTIENSYIGPYTSVGSESIIEHTEVEFSILLDRCRLLNVPIRIESSLLGYDATIRKTVSKPRTHKFIVGDQSHIEITD